MKRNVWTMAALAACLLTSSCVTKKQFDGCQQENKELTKNYQSTKEELAAAKSRITSLEEQLAGSKKAYEAVQGALDKSLTNASQNNVSIEKLVDQIN